MEHQDLQDRFARLSTAHLADACIRAKVAVRCAPAGMRALTPGMRLFGPALPAQHVGSVDIFLEAFASAAEGDVLVVDNAGRMDEACVGDLVALEAQKAGLAGIAIWGLHRDSVDLAVIGLPVFSMGTLSTGPQRLDDRPTDALVFANFGDLQITRRDLVIGDEDGVVFVPSDRADEILGIAERVRDTERHQAELMREGISLRRQVRFDAYIAERETTPSLTFREHLRRVDGAIEE
jgi:regulator of RNase E activity RraA